MLSRRQLLQVGALAGAGALVGWRFDSATGLLLRPSRAYASVQVPDQVALPGAQVPQFVTALPLPQRTSNAVMSVLMKEFQQKVLPDSFYANLPQAFRAGTWLWGYKVDGTPLAYPANTIIAQRGQATTITYINQLPVSQQVVGKELTIDQTLHWADPANAMGSMQPYTGSPPTVVHLHGAEVLSSSDGGPNQWFTPDGKHGSGYASVGAQLSNGAVYRYPNNQEATGLWFHDHALGITRINVYSGLAGMYLIRDQFDTGLSNNPLGLPAGGFEVELVIQDRQFDTNGQLFFPDGFPAGAGMNGDPSNPSIHPFWVPEFFGDVIVVNGRSWPYLEVEPRRYRFRVLDGSNARFYRLRLVEGLDGAPGPAIWQIGTDGGLLDKPVKLAESATALPLFLAPGERADVIIDFTGQENKTFTMINTQDAVFPFPSGGAPDPALDGRVMQFRVKSQRSSADTTFDPATSTAPLRGIANRQPAIVRLANPTSGTLATGVKPSLKRQLVLVEFEGNGGPVEAFLNNTKWHGMRDGTSTVVPGGKPDLTGQGIFMTEMPRVGSTEVWEILNLTDDAHPIHVHLIQFQVLNRQQVQWAIDPATGQPTWDSGFNPYRNGANRTLAAPAAAKPGSWDYLFPGGTFAGVQADGTWGSITYPAHTFIPGYGPPTDYTAANADGALGGNLAFGKFLVGNPVPPDPNEAGWKDTFKVLPGMVNRVVLRWAPQAVAVGAVKPGQNLFSFDPTRGPGYVWHCHILDHEDNEMMRPYLPTL